MTREKLSDACFPAAKRNDGGEGAFVSSVTEESTPFPSPIEAWVAASHMREVITSGRASKLDLETGASIVRLGSDRALSFLLDPGKGEG